MKSVIVDTCIWYALVDEKDVYAGCNEKIRQVLKHHVILVPYPSLYETINTKLIKNERKQADKLFGYLNNKQLTEESFSFCSSIALFCIAKI